MDYLKLQVKELNERYTRKENFYIDTIEGFKDRLENYRMENDIRKLVDAQIIRNNIELVEMHRLKEKNEVMYILDNIENQYNKLNLFSFDFQKSIKDFKSKLFISKVEEIRLNRGFIKSKDTKTEKILNSVKSRLSF